MVKWLLLFVTTFAYADCPELYPNSTTIAIDNTIELCNSFYVVRYDVDRRATLISAEVIKPKTESIERSRSFQHDDRVDSSPVTDDYTNTGYDRGHMTPAGDATNRAEMDDTFLLTNITPQSPRLNRVKWRMLESDVREMVRKIGRPVHVVTGAVYNDQKEINNIAIPTAYFKIVYLPSVTKAYYVLNSDTAIIEEMPLTKLKSKVGDYYFGK